MSVFTADLLGDPRPFLDRLFTALAAAGVEVAAYPMDHVCYRVETLDRYRELRARLATHATLLHEAVIGGRPIASFKLRMPEVVGDRFLDVIELPAPKPGRLYAEGFEHAEFVIGPRPFAGFLARYAHIPFDCSAAAKPVNPELRLELGALAAKFHHQSLEAVIRDELQGDAQRLTK